ncbi:MAG: GspL/Epsl periplasmic domain-containing protein [bacterium]|nr:GspL/Epsl periplasmic domain-containing protein [bacterium]
MSGLFLTANEWALVAPGQQLRVPRSEPLDVGLAGFFAQAAQLLSPDARKLDLVIDQSLFHFLSLRLPLSAARRLQALLPFELENHLLMPVAKLNLPYERRLDKQQSVTWVAIYGVEREWLAHLRKLAGEAGLELKRVFALENLLGLEMPPQASGLHLRLCLESGLARLLLYRDGFPTAFSSLEIAEGEGFEAYQAWVKDLNAVIAAAGLEEGALNLSLDRSAQLYFEVEDNRLQLRQPFEPKPLPSAARAELLAPALLKRKGLVPLMAEQGAWRKEIIKHKSQLIRTSGFAAGLGLLWVLWLGLGLVQGNKQVARLQAQYAQALSQVAPGLNPTNGLEVLQERVASLKGSAAGTAAEPYLNSRRLAELSSLREKAPSFELKRLSAKGKDWTLTGKTTSAQDLEKAKVELQRLFPAESYGMSLSQQAKGDSEVNFSISLVHKGGR